MINKASSTFCVLRDSNFVSEGFKKRGYEHWLYYSKIENDHQMDLEVKKKHMEEWWDSDMGDIKNEQLTKDQFIEMTQNSCLYFRHGIHHLFDLKQDLKFPMLVVSAGIGDVIKWAFELYFGSTGIQEESLDPFTIISNLGMYDDDSILIDFRKPTVTVLNKSMHVAELFEQQKLHDQETGHHLRTNMIMMGDIAADVKMIDKIEYESWIKIGYLNYKENLENDDFLDNFKQVYDIIITNDGNLDLANALIQLVKGDNLDDIKIENEDILDLFGKVLKDE